MRGGDLTAQSPAAQRTRVLELAAKNWAFLFLIILLIVFSFTGRGFLSLANFQNIVHLSTVLLLLCVSETFVIISGGIDLSVGMVLGFSAVISSKIMQIMLKAGYAQGGPASRLGLPQDWPSASSPG